MVLDDTHTKKSLGQHWLFDEDALDSIADSVLTISNSSTILEIGPGLGTLTAKLLDAGRSVHAVEFDSDLAKDLRARVEKRLGRKNLHELIVTEHDILTFDLNSLPKDYSVCANIPYYLTSKLLRVLGESANPPKACALLIQKEVAERVCAEPGHTSLLSLTTQFYFEAHLGDVVPAKLFTPPPKVDSQVIVLIRREKPLFDISTRDFFRLMKIGFSERRKVLTNTLSAGYGLKKEEVGRLLEACLLKKTARPQELSLEEWHRLFIELKKVDVI